MTTNPKQTPTLTETEHDALAEIRAAHMLCTHSAPRPGGVNIHKAGCSCGARYAWQRREAEHAEHVDATIIEHFAAREAAARREALLEAANLLWPPRYVPGMDDFIGCRAQEYADDYAAWLRARAEEIKAALADNPT